MKNVASCVLFRGKKAARPKQPYLDRRLHEANKKAGVTLLPNHRQLLDQEGNEEKLLTLTDGYVADIRRTTPAHVG